jgi:hypothetical protein
LVRLLSFSALVFINTYDKQAYKDKQEELANAQKEYNDWETDIATKRRRDELEKEKTYEQSLLDAKDDAYNKQLSKLELFYSDMDTMVKVKMDELNTTYGGKWDEIVTMVEGKINIIKSKIAQLTGVNAGFMITSDGKVLTGDYEHDKKVLGFDTGGYTGSSQGLALLHEKELVLNKQDTSNFLDLTKVLRSLKDFSLSNLIKPLVSLPNISNGKQNNQPTSLIIKELNLPNVTDGNSFMEELKTIHLKAQMA